SPPTSKRIKTSVPASAPSHLLAPQQVNPYSRVPSYEGIPMPQTQIPPPNPRKRRASPPAGTTAAMPAPGATGTGGEPGHEQGSGIAEPTPKKKGRTNTPWTAEEEQRLKTMRDAGRSWSEIAKTFPTRTEGSVKKHWYKDMHYAEFAEDESIALRDAIKEYEANKWKVIGQKVGKPAKASPACEQYAKEHFKDL
ncbi:SANT/Myb-like DNA-binding domain-containing protein, partial [Aspergillus homomorphus CBS 101889]